MYIWHLLQTAFKYNMIKGAAVVKILQAVSGLAGIQPWAPEWSTAVEVLIDFAVAILVVIGLNHAHDAQPGV